jgi:hypothetical protein
MGAQVSGAGGCAQIRPELGVYVLGAIIPAGRAVVGRHLVSCPRCRDEVAGLAGIPALLRRVAVAAAAELPGQRPGGDGPGPQPGLLDGLLRRMAAARRQRRWRLAAAAAVLAAAAAAGWVPQLLHPAALPSRATAAWWTAAASGFDPATRAGASVRYAPEPWGTELEATITGIASGTACRIWAVTASGQRAAAGGWTVTGDDRHAWHPASVPFPAATLVGFDITADGKILVTIPLRP